jgi:hypothetical protein
VIKGRGANASWCDKNDAICDSGISMAVHESYNGTYGAEIVQFVVDKWKNSTSQSGSGSNATATASSSATGTSTGSPTSSPSGHTGSASGLALGQSLLLGAMMLLAVWSLH